MSAITVEIPDSIRKKLEELSKSQGFSLEQFIASAASEKLAVLLQTDFLESEAAHGSREAFERHLAAVPDVDPTHADDLVK